jgi:hypothetical protein
MHSGKFRTALAAFVEFLPTTGPKSADVRLVRIGGTSLALLTTEGEIQSHVVVPRGWTDRDEAAAYVR